MVATPLFAGVVGFFALVQVFCIGLGLMRIPMTQALAIGGAGGSLVLSVAFAMRFRVRGHAPAEAPTEVDSLVRGFRGALWLLTIGAFTWLGWLWVQLLTVAWHRPPVRWDSLVYHIPAIHEWVMKGYVSFYPLDPRLAGAPDQVIFAGWVNFPMGVELTSFFAYFLLGTDRLVDATNLWYWPLAILALVVIAGRLGAGGPTKWLAGGLLFAIVGFLQQSATAYIDPGFNSAVMAGLAAAALACFGGPGAMKWRIVLLGAALGLVLGSKGQGLPYAGVMLLMTLAVMGWQLGPRRARVVARRALMTSVVMLAVGGYWSIRNAVSTGNPLYPAQLKIGEKVLAPGYDFSGYGSEAWAVPDVLKPYPSWSRGFVAWTQPDRRGNGGDFEPFRVYHSTVGGLGFFWLIAAVPAVMCLWIGSLRRHRERLALLAFLTLCMVGLYYFTIIPWQARFAYWHYALGLPAFAVVLHEGISGCRRSIGHRFILALCFLAIGVAVWESNGAVQEEARIDREAGSMSGAPNYRSAVNLLWPWMDEEEGFRELLQADRVARGPWATWQTTGQALFNGVLAMPMAKRTIRVLPSDVTPGEIDQLQEDGFRWVLWNAARGDSPPTELLKRTSHTFEHHSAQASFYALDLGEGNQPLQEGQR